ncbi:hypothetical protein ACGFZK_09040 [Streptomyces sp. NPDC048257]|uniref:AMIN-like domain-containing (lipo)protein n=1 Tax=Streptomyces sp. NPDC048257 TaxID=3365526 RepID=UPI0037180E58
MRHWIILPATLVLAATTALPVTIAAAAPTTAAAAGAVEPAMQCPIGWDSPAEGRSTGQVPELRGIRSGEHPCYDRLVFDVPGSSSANPVGYQVRYADALLQDASGDPLPVRGGAVLEVMVDSPAYDRQTMAPTIPGRSGQPLPGVDVTGYRTFRDAVFGASSEGRTQIGLGLRARLPYRVLQLDDRLVVDVAHTGSGNPTTPTQS